MRMMQHLYGQDAKDDLERRRNHQIAVSRTARSLCTCGERLRAALRAAKAVGKSLLGDGVRKDGELARVRAICAACETRVAGRHARSWCGAPAVEVPGVSCGCLVTFKTLLASESCPQKKW